MKTSKVEGFNCKACPGIFNQGQISFIKGEQIFSSGAETRLECVKFFLFPLFFIATGTSCREYFKLNL